MVATIRNLRLIIRRSDCHFPVLSRWKSSLCSGPQRTKRICLTSLPQRSDEIPLARLLLKRCWVAIKGWVQKFLWATFQLVDGLIGLGVLRFLKLRFGRCCFRAGHYYIRMRQYIFSPEQGCVVLGMPAASWDVCIAILLSAMHLHMVSCQRFPKNPLPNPFCIMFLRALFCIRVYFLEKLNKGKMEQRGLW